MYRMGMLVSLRSMHLKSAAVGLMITASHNPQDDNGVKLIDPHGEMLDSSWEGLATELANVSNDKDVCAKLIDIVSTHNISPSYTPRVFIGRDTRRVVEFPVVTILYRTRPSVSCASDKKNYVFIYVYIYICF